MQLSDISPWMAALALVLAVFALGAFAVVDRRLARVMQRSLLGTALVLFVSMAVAWASVKMGSGWGTRLCLLAWMAVVAIRSVVRAVATYRRSHQCTREHYEYLLANGASPLEAQLPSLRRALRATATPLLRQPLLSLVSMAVMCGLLLGGASPLAALLATVLLLLATFSLAVVASVAALWLMARSR